MCEKVKRNSPRERILSYIGAHLCASFQDSLADEDEGMCFLIVGIMIQ